MVKKAPFLPAQPLRAKTRFVQRAAAASEEAMRRHSRTLSLSRQALFPWPYVEPLSDARTKLGVFSPSG